MEQKIIMTCGFPGSGKSTYISKTYPNAHILSNDLLSKSQKLTKEFEKALVSDDIQVVVLDNTHLTKKNRIEFIEIAKKFNKKIEVLQFNSYIEKCQIVVLKRQWNKFNKLYLEGKGEVQDPHIFPPAVLFKSRTSFEEPTLEEGFSSIYQIQSLDPKVLFTQYPNKAIFFDIDGTLRKTDHLVNKYPIHPDEVELFTDKEKMKSKIDLYRKQGYLFFGVSNQSGISKGILTEQDCEACMNKTKQLLDFDDLEIKWCSHRAAPISCYCRKPQVGLAMYFIEKYKVNPVHCIMVGDRTTDKTFGERLDMKFITATTFWK